MLTCLLAYSSRKVTMMLAKYEKYTQRKLLAPGAGGDGDGDGGGGGGGGGDLPEGAKSAACLVQ